MAGNYWKSDMRTVENNLKYDKRIGNIIELY